MSRAVWIVSEDEQDSQGVIAVFSSRRKMEKALSERRATYNINDKGWGSGSFFEGKYIVYVSLDRVKVDDWK